MKDGELDDMDDAPTTRTRLRRKPERGHYDRATIDGILDEGLVCHVGFAVDGQPFVIPATYARVDDQLYLHGSAGSRMLRTLGGGVPMCVTVTLLDGLVLARSARRHSMNYRSVVVLGTATPVTDAVEWRAGLEAIVEHALPGRWREVRPPTERELRETSVLRLPLTEASAKIRSGPPVDEPADLGVACWAGVIPLALRADAAEPAPDLALDIARSLAPRPYQRGNGAAKRP